MNILEYKNRLLLELEYISSSTGTEQDLLRNNLALLGIIGETIMYHKSPAAKIEKEKVEKELQKRIDDDNAQLAYLRSEYSGLEKKKKKLEEQRPEIQAIINDIEQLKREIHSFEELEKHLETQAQLKAQLKDFKSKKLRQKQEQITEWIANTQVAEFPSLDMFVNWALEIESQLDEVNRSKVLEFERSCNKLQDVMTNINKLNEQIQGNQQNLRTSEKEKETKEIQLNLLSVEYGNLIEKLHQINRELENLSATHTSNVDSFERHFKANNELWEVVGENYRQNDIQNYVEENLALNIRNNLAEFDSVLKNIIGDLEKISIEELPIQSLS